MYCCCCCCCFCCCCCCCCCGCCCCCVVVLTLTRIMKSVVTGQAPVTLELRNTPGKTHTTQGGTRIYDSSRNSFLHQKLIKVKSGVSLRCARSMPVHTSQLTPGETNYSDCHPRKTTTYILHVVSITTHTHDRRKSTGEKKQRKERR